MALIDKQWMQLDCTEAGLAMCDRLEGIVTGGFAIWHKAFVMVKKMNGRINAKLIVSKFNGNHVSRKQVMAVLIESGDFELDEFGIDLCFTTKAMEKFCSQKSGKSKQEADVATRNNAVATRKNDAATRNIDVATRKNDAATRNNDAATRESDASNARASSSLKLKERIEKEEEESLNTDSKKNVKESDGCVAPLSGMKMEADRRELQRATAQLDDVNYTPSAELLASMPERLKIYSGEYWYPYICWLYDAEGQRRWQDVLRSQLQDREFAEMVCTHWHEAVCSFVEHALMFGTIQNIQNKRNAQNAFALYLRPRRLPARKLKARLKWQSLLDAASDGREQRFYAYMLSECPHLIELDDAMSFSQFDELRTRYGKPAVLSVLRDMENDPRLCKRSAYNTAASWLEKRSQKASR